MSVNDLLAAMFPGDPQRNIPSFDTLGLQAETLFNSDILQRLSRGLNNLTSSGPVEINDVLSSLRKVDPELVKAFIDRALVVYFTSGSVIRALRQGPETLFPNSRILPDIDYTLLEPVFERGATQRPRND